jgi:hypothetical protein
MLQNHWPSALGRGRRFRSFYIASFLVAAAARCSSDDITSHRYADPATAVLSDADTLATVRWNLITQTLIARNKPSQNHAWRMFAYSALAQHVAVEEHSRSGMSRFRIRGAVAGASAPVLKSLFPADSAFVDSVVRAEELSFVGDRREAFLRGVATGRVLGAKVVARAQNDRFNTPWTGTVPTGPGKWSSLANPPAPPLLPLLGKAQPFFMTNGSQFRPPPPPAFGSAAFLASLAEVRRIADTRTPTQDSIAKFWAIPTGSLIVGYWNNVALGLIAKYRLGERAAAHALALSNTAGQDASIACHDAKYVYWLIRPSAADPAIITSVGVPNHPSYPSNHSCLSTVTANVLGAVFPKDKERLQSLANEASMSRLYGGIHYRFDMDAGIEIARKIGNLAIQLDRNGHLKKLVLQ